jgi:hypothetical protein
MGVLNVVMTAYGSAETAESIPTTWFPARFPPWFPPSR